MANLFSSAHVLSTDKVTDNVFCYTKLNDLQDQSLGGNPPCLPRPDA